MVWIGGFVLAVALYVIGPDRFVDTCWAVFDAIDATLRDLAAQLGARTYGVVRAGAIAIFVVFAVLCVLASRRGHRGFWPFIVITLLFMALTWHPFGIYPAPLSRWIVALALVVVAAIIMTQRLTAAPLRRGGPLPPYPPGQVR
jgi:UDP-N-acetylmuramyl pentapeptide phosphotransferase/UDP-N-acetylglucosamine-1-phosphate transferase